MNINYENYKYLLGFLYRIKRIGLYGTFNEFTLYNYRYFKISWHISKKRAYTSLPHYAHTYCKITSHNSKINPKMLLNIVPKFFAKNILSCRTNSYKHKYKLVDKVWFYNYMKDNAIDCPVTFFHIKDGTYYDLHENPIDSSVYNGMRMFTKLNGGSCGAGTSIIRFDNRKNYENDIIFQEIVTPHNSIQKLAGVSSLPTIRLNSYLRKNNTVEIVSAFIKFPPSGAVSDNMKSGTFGVSIDYKAGKLTNKYMGLSDFRPIVKDNHILHPISGLIIDGFAIPYWNEVILILDKLHSLFKELRFVGWDIAIGERGPIIIEGNSVGDVFFEQMISNPYFETDYVQENINGTTF